MNKFAIDGILRFDLGRGGLPRAVVTGPEAEAEIYLQGAHLTAWTPRGHRPVLFTSERSFFESGKPIRGGVPLVFPWFGPRGGGLPGPMHGYARLSNWDVEAARVRDDGAVEILFALPEHALTFRVSLGQTLEMELTARNPTADPIVIEDAFHTYFAVGDIHQVSITGLAGTACLDKADAAQRKLTGPDPIRFARETDQVHFSTPAACVIHDPAWARGIVIEKSGSATTVVWNPWIAKTASLPDMAPEDWKSMVCVETANAIDDAITLAPGAAHTMSARIRLS